MNPPRAPAFALVLRSSQLRVRTRTAYSASAAACCVVVATRYDVRLRRRCAAIMSVGSGGGGTIFRLHTNASIMTAANSAEMYRCPN